MAWNKLLRDERGANAIEYSLLGGFLALGLLASLVTTKSSLNTALGTISSQVASVATGASSTPPAPATPPAPTNPVTSQRTVAAATTSSRYAYWSAKTLATTVVTNPSATSQQTVFTYADGTSGTYLVNYDSTGKLLSEVVTTNPYGFAGRTSDSLQFTYGADGSQQSMIYADRYASGVVRQVSSSAASGGWAEWVQIYDTSGNLTSQGASTATGAGVLANGAGDEIYFRALANK